MKSLIWMMFSVPCLSIAQVASFSVEVSKDSILFGNNLKVTYTLKNADGKFEPPAFSEFTVISGPNTSTSMYSVNGNTTRTTAYTYFIQPKKEGEFFIEEAYLVHRTDESKNLTADAVKIVVLPNPDGIIENDPGTTTQNLFFSWPMETERILPQEESQAARPKRKIKRI